MVPSVVPSTFFCLRHNTACLIRAITRLLQEVGGGGGGGGIIRLHDLILNCVVKQSYSMLLKAHVH